MGLSRHLSLAALALAAVFCGGSALGQRVEVDFDREADFSGLRTFAWDPDTPPPQSFSDLDGNRIDGAIRDSVERALKNRGFFQLMRDADFLVSFSVTGRPSEAQNALPEEAPPAEGQWRPFERAAGKIDLGAEGAVVLSVLDGKTGRVLWQARCAEIVEGGKKLERKIDGGVKRMLKEFPPE